MLLPFEPEISDEWRARKRVRGTHPLGGFAYDLDLTVPYLATAIHAGHGVREELAPLLALPESARLAEEDMATERIIADCPSTIWGLDSRAEYDLNRPPDQAIPLTAEMFWGIRVYDAPPDEAANRRTMEKYQAFYRFAATVAGVLLERFGACLVYDIHSYNILRQQEKGHRHPPVFNLGTRGIDRPRWEGPVTSWLRRLEAVNLSGKNVSVAENRVFGGQGAFCAHLSAWDANILVLPTEISKIYMDERTGEPFEGVIDELRGEMAAAVSAHGEAYRRDFCR